MVPTEQLPADQFSQRYRSELIPLNTKIQWFSVIPLNPEDLTLNIEEPLGSLPPRLVEMLPRLSVFLVPFLKHQGKQADLIVFEAPEAPERSDSFQIFGPDEATIFLAAQDVSGNELHYNLFSALGSIAWEVAPAPIRTKWLKDLKDELRREVHGEIDELSWQKKNALLARQSLPIRDSKLFRDYARASFIDSMTLFLHGICCDIDVEPSPRQVPSHEIRRRLDLLRGFYPLGEGFALFPEELNRGRGGRDSRRKGNAGENGKGQPMSAPISSTLPAGQETPDRSHSEDSEKHRDQ